MSNKKKDARGKYELLVNTQHKTTSADIRLWASEGNDTERPFQYADIQPFKRRKVKGKNV